MLYAILCYNSEDIVGAWTKEENATVMARLGVVQEKLAKQGRLGPVARLLPTTAATTVRKAAEPLVIDGPFVETKEQLLGFYVVECATLEDAVETAKELTQANGGVGGYEIRPMAVFRSNSDLGNRA
jgi:hypothetical protein